MPSLYLAVEGGELGGGALQAAAIGQVKTHRLGCHGGRRGKPDKTGGGFAACRSFLLSPPVVELGITDIVLGAEGGDGLRTFTLKLDEIEHALA